jgi:hypothetical protein
MPPRSASIFSVYVSLTVVVLLEEVGDGIMFFRRGQRQDMKISLLSGAYVYQCARL